MDNQEAFSKVYAHLMTQGEAAKGCDPESGGPMCYYRSANLKCAVGCLIPDEIYKSQMEGRSVSNLIEYFPEIYNLFEGLNTSLLNDLQTLHDVDEPWEWQGKFEHLALKYNLSIPKL